MYYLVLGAGLKCGYQEFPDFLIKSGKKTFGISPDTAYRDGVVIEGNGCIARVRRSNFDVDKTPVKDEMRDFFREVIAKTGVFTIIDTRGTKALASFPTKLCEALIGMSKENANKR
ncbi:hypothetical protein MIDIC_80011 [Alphaproteobacteria bacterium]